MGKNFRDEYKHEDEWQDFAGDSEKSLGSLGEQLKRALVDKETK